MICNKMRKAGKFVLLPLLLLANLFSNLQFANAAKNNILLAAKDTLAPKPNWQLDCNGNVKGASVTDEPEDNPLVRSGLKNIFYDSINSVNYKFKYKDFIPGQTYTTTWELVIIDNTKDAKGIITFTDVAGNSMTLAVNYITPEIFIYPELHDFGNLKIGDSAEFDFQIKNNYINKDFVLQWLKLQQNNQNFVIIAPALPLTLVPGASEQFKVKFFAIKDGFFEDSLVVGDTCILLKKALVKAQVKSPIILVGDKPGQIDADFGNVPLQLTSSKDIEIRNIGSADLILYDFQSPKSSDITVSFSKVFSPASPLIIKHFEQPVIIRVVFKPTANQIYNDTIVISSNARTIDSIGVIKGTGISKMP